MSHLQLVQPADFFREKISDAASTLQLNLTDELEFYLVNLLCDFINPENLNLDELDLLDTPLALLHKRAIESSPDMQIRIYKKLGDISLYVTGYFQDSLYRKTVDADYYISMGSGAYRRISHLMQNHHRDEHFTRIYGDLSREFRNLVALVTELADDLPKRENPNIIAIYERWSRTGSERLRRILQDEGILPVNLGGHKSTPQ